MEASTVFHIVTPGRLLVITEQVSYCVGTVLPVSQRDLATTTNQSAAAWEAIFIPYNDSGKKKDIFLPERIRPRKAFTQYTIHRL